MKAATQKLTRRLAALILVLVLAVGFSTAAWAEGVPRRETPVYKVAFYAANCYHIQDENGRRSGYGYEMMQGLSKYMQCTFDYVGYDKTPAESMEMLRSGEVDLYTAAKATDACRAEFAVSQHPAIMVTTCMNIKVGNSKVVAGDYATYEGMCIGLLQSQTYNDGFLQWADEKGFAYTVTYYDTLADLTNALKEDKVDAIVDSYIRTPEDELTIEDFGQTAYYILARKEDQGLIDALDAAFDAMNIDNPNWRVELYNKYRGAAGHNTKFTAEESALLAQMQQSGTTVRAAAAPDNAPYSWYADGKMQGIAVDLAQKTAEALGLTLEVVPTATYKDYNALLQSGEADLCLDLDSGETTYGDTAYQLTDTYMRTTVSLLRQRGACERVHCLPGGRVIFRCTDTGIGMTPEFIGHITEDYVRAEDSRVSKVQGTGLGMSVVKGFTDLMGGTLDMYSHEGHGSTFVVSIPFAEADDAQRAAVLAPHKAGETTADFTGKRVLLAEDNALNAEIAVELLQSIGLKVDWAEDGQKAVGMFEKSAPGSYFAVFMDMQMPVMDGVEATRRIRASDRPDHDVPIFAMTANTFAADRKKCYDAGMSGYIPKPIDLETITHVLEEETGG